MPNDAGRSTPAQTDRQRLPFLLGPWKNVPPQACPSLQEQLQRECEAMARYALKHALTVSPEVISRLLARRDDRAGDARSIEELAFLHAKLAQAVTPATPQGISILDQDPTRKSTLSLLGPVRLVRVLTLTAVFFMAAVILIGLSGEVTSQNIARGMLESSGATLLLNTLFLLCCAGLGAAYAALFQAHRYVANATYDPRYDASYGARIILGVIAGLILTEMLPAHLFNEGSMHNFGKPALAMLGGFSATAVHRLLSRLVETLETVVRGNGSDELRREMETQRALQASDRAQARSDLATRLVELQQSLGDELTPEEMRQRISDLARGMLAPALPASTPPSTSGKA